jgi:hypothetical protein
VKRLGQLCGEPQVPEMNGVESPPENSCRQATGAYGSFSCRSM